MYVLLFEGSLAYLSLSRNILSLLHTQFKVIVGVAIIECSAAYILLSKNTYLKRQKAKKVEICLNITSLNLVNLIVQRHEIRHNAVQHAEDSSTSCTSKSKNDTSIHEFEKKKWIQKLRQLTEPIILQSRARSRYQHNLLNDVIINC
jgi:hypothetical protein